MTVAADQLRSFIERLERLEEEKAALSTDIREIYAEAKGTGFDTKVMRAIIKARKVEANERQKQEAILDLYMHALGMAEGESAAPTSVKLATPPPPPPPTWPGPR